MRLRQLLEGYEIRNYKDVEVLGLSYDSRRVKPGDLFFAMKGRTFDSHTVLDQVEARGAAALVVERPVKTRLPHAVVPRVRDVMGPISSRFYGHPSKHLAVVGITGTNGKTTTAFLVATGLRALGRRADMITTVKYEIAGRSLPGERTTPEAPDLQRMLALSRDGGAEFVVMEASSHGLAEGRVEGVHFRVGAFTNLSRDHLDYHGSMEAYREAKARLFRSLPRDSWAVINLVDPAGRYMAEATRARVLFYGSNGKGDIGVRVMDYGWWGLLLSVRYKNTTRPLTLPLPGLHNAPNAACALGIFLALGFSLEEACAALERAEGAPGRFQLVNPGDPYAVVVDYAHTPDALARTLRAARLLTSGKLVVVFGAGGERDRGKRPRMGRVAEEEADLVILTNDNPRGEDPMAIIGDILAGMESQPLVIPDRREAIERAVALLSDGDTLVIAGKGHEEYQEIMGQKLPFSDLEVARECLGSRR